jgi:hypothetical protein
MVTLMTNTPTPDAPFIMKYGPHAGHVIRGNYKTSLDKTGRMVAHEWRRGANRWVRCDLALALAGAP